MTDPAIIDEPITGEIHVEPLWWLDLLAAVLMIGIAGFTFWKMGVFS